MKKSKNEILSGSNFGELMVLHDPFGIKDEKGNIKFFKSYEECYTFVLQHLFAHNRRGYVDIVLLVSQLSKVKLTECKALVDCMRGLWGTDDARMIRMPWHEDFETDYHDLVMLFKCLHLITESKFDESMFRSAIEKLHTTWVRIIGSEILNQQKNETKHCN